ncbi:MAG: response regulator transcription factor, partial [Anaerolineales bacterium]|nr:response regulator transcription factor [Anaerolineales bacterium]MDW8448090.1 response regulator transcription factor [Anaerolineales bacterium]
RGFEVCVVESGKAALQALENFDPDVVIVDAVSLRSSGKRICRSLRERSNGLPIVLIAEDKSRVDEECVTVTLVVPFTIRKLLNRIIPLLPSEGQRMLRRGPIHLDLELRRVRCHGRESRLTPRLTKLLKILLLNAGKVVERAMLFREVWETDYLEDTRTLDVHVSWLRKAIELDPKRPRYLKTLRGVGYRLDIYPEANAEEE